MWIVISKEIGQINAKKKTYDTEIFPILEWQKIHFFTVRGLVIICQEFLKFSFSYIKVTVGKNWRFTILKGQMSL